ncbi:MAG: glycosyltransferase family 4 protein, partial [bacterium]
AQAAILVQKKLSGTQVEYFHAHFSHGPTTVAYFASWLTGFPYSFSAHAKDIYLQDTEFLTKKIWGAKFAVTCTEYNRRHLANIVGEDAPVYRVYHGIDLELFHPRKKTARNGVTKPNILSIGRFVPKKGFPVLLKALKQVKDQGVDFHCDLVGGGEMQDELAALSQELGLQENVTLHGKKSQTELLIFYQKADLFALACEVQKDGDRDGIPNVLVEAMAMKIPVISTRISGIPELITHNESGLLVEQKKPQVMADAIALLLRDRILANRLAEGGLHKIQTDFDNKQNVQLIADFLNTAFAGEEIVKVSEKPIIEKTQSSDRIKMTEPVLSIQ